MDDDADENGSTNITIKVIASTINHVPFFSSSTYQGTVTEGALPGTVILNVSTADSDSGNNGVITYRLEGPKETLSYLYITANGRGPLYDR